jgi:hypothetical protein
MELRKYLRGAHCTGKGDYFVPCAESPWEPKFAVIITRPAPVDTPSVQIRQHW